VADRIVVLNRGANAGNLLREEATMEKIVSLIVGKVL
jgi:ABC-type sugar transport system ATPase subunit